MAICCPSKVNFKDIFGLTPEGSGVFVAVTDDNCCLLEKCLFYRDVVHLMSSLVFFD